VQYAQPDEAEKGVAGLERHQRLNVGVHDAIEEWMGDATKEAARKAPPTCRRRFWFRSSSPTEVLGVEDVDASILSNSPRDELGE
jgi:hypothetical protein